MIAAFTGIRAEKSEDGLSLTLQIIAHDESDRRWFVRCPVVVDGETDIQEFALRLLGSLQSLHFICVDPEKAELLGLLPEGTVQSATLDAELRKLTADCGPRVH